MIASRLGLAVILGISIVLAVALAIDLHRAPPIVDRTVAGGLAVEDVSQLEWDRGPPAARIVVTREGNEWRWAAPIGGLADRHTVSDVLAALRAAHWHRRGEAVAAGAVHTTLTIRTATSTKTIGIASPLAGTEQSWLVVDDHAVLVDRWVARALDPEPLTLRIRQPFALGSDAIVALRDGVELRVTGSPARTESPSHVIADPDLVSALDHALAALTIVQLPSGPLPAADRLVVEAQQVRVELGGACPGASALVAAQATTGAGCVTPDAFAAVEAAVRALSAGAPNVVDRRITRVPPSQITLADGMRLDLTGRPRLLIPALPTDPDTRLPDAEIDRVDELLAVLDSPCDAVVAAPTTKRVHSLTIGSAHGMIEVALYPGNVIQRTGDDVALRISPAAWAVLSRPWTAYRDRTLWVEEPTSLTKLTIDTITYTRGATIGEWSRDPAGKVDLPAIDALVTALSQLATVDAAAARVVPVHRVTITFTPPFGNPPTRSHVLELGADCAADVDGRAVRLAASLCSDLARLGR